MDLGSFLDSLTAADLALLLIYAGAFILGFFQGGTRALLGLLAWLFAFVIGVTVWQPLGDWLSGSWTLYSLPYNQMLAFLIGFITALVIGGIVIVTFTKRSALLPRWPLVDEVLGGVLFVVLALLITGAILAALDSAYPLGLAWALRRAMVDVVARGAHRVGHRRLDQQHHRALPDDRLRTDHP